MNRDYRERWHGEKHAPPPPRHLMDEISAAAAAGDTVRRLAAEAAYVAWAEEQGWVEPAPEPQGWMAEHEAREDDR